MNKDNVLEQETLSEIALQLRGFDPELSRGILAIDRIAKQSRSSQALRRQDRASVRQLLVQKSWRLVSALGLQATETMGYLSQIAAQEDDWFSLLWFDSPQTYLIALQNTAEKRPNGWFFGSFLKVVIDRGAIAQRTLIDSYVPQVLRPNTFIDGPSRLTNFLPDQEIHFVGANKIGFTYHDGANIKKLYERAYLGEQVRGVIFVSTDLLTYIEPELQSRVRERQFINAATDLIRWANLPGKKENYLRDVSSLLQSQSIWLLRRVIANLDDVIDQRKINIYLEDVSHPIHRALRESHLTTRFEEDHLYFWDSNISFNKIDTFVSKEIRIFDTQGNLMIQSDRDIVSIASLPSWSYRVVISYRLAVPDSYRSFIQQLADLYRITLSEREYHILGLTDVRSTRGVVYASKQLILSPARGDLYHSSAFVTPFSTNLYYKTKITQPNGMHVIEFEMEK